MRFSVTQNVHKEYYEEVFNQWLEHRSVYRKWQQVVGAVFILIGVFVLFLGSTYRYLSGVMVLYGGYQIYDFVLTKRKWMQDRLGSGVNESSTKFVFDEEYIVSEGPFSNTESTWESMKDVVESEKGVFLIPENGISIYLQKSIFNQKEDWKWIIKKVNANKKSND